MSTLQFIYPGGSWRPLPVPNAPSAKAPSTPGLKASAVWWGIATGFALAVLGMVLILTVFSAGVPAAPQSPAQAAVATHATHQHRLEIYQDPAEALTGALPVP
jgi:hypothetical protein